MPRVVHLDTQPSEDLNFLPSPKNLTISSETMAFLNDNEIIVISDVEIETLTPDSSLQRPIATKPYQKRKSLSKCGEIPPHIQYFKSTQV
ncbi:Uncharacterized protein DAT39_016037 [Clarias magur]|uniref:Uncharacterized protein n=1 Tax=Clarias magur TaxID=1594786 RepID=A0A8J4UEM3_CLAMG|nr:Uncharacterized protein DAT39_016037 [Clarias magur]